MTLALKQPALEPETGFKCTDCQEPFELQSGESPEHDLNGEIVCDTCFNDYLCHCQWCGKVETIDDSMYVCCENYCRDCFFKRYIKLLKDNWDYLKQGNVFMGEDLIAPDYFCPVCFYPCSDDVWWSCTDSTVFKVGEFEICYHLCRNCVLNTFRLPKYLLGKGVPHPKEVLKHERVMRFVAANGIRWLSKHKLPFKRPEILERK